MNLVQHFHDYLVGTKLVSSDQVEVWESEARVFSKHDFSGGHDFIKRREYKINLSIDDIADGFDYDAIEFAVVWWLNVWGPNADQSAARFLVESDIQNRRITDIWIGFDVEETTKFIDGETIRCRKPNIIKNKNFDPAGLPMWLRFVNWGFEAEIISGDGAPVDVVELVPVVDGE